MLQEGSGTVPAEDATGDMNIFGTSMADKKHLVTMVTPASASQACWKSGLHCTWQAWHRGAAEYAISKTELSPFSGILITASISQIINTMLLQV